MGPDHLAESGMMVSVKANEDRAKGTSVKADGPSIQVTPAQPRIGTSCAWTLHSPALCALLPVRAGSPCVRATLAHCGDHTITQASRGEIQSA
jgi:hypothetical protein